MEAYKLGKIIENQKLDVHLSFEQVKTVKETLRKSLKRGKEMEIQKNDTEYKEETIEELFDEGISSESDVTIVDLLENNKILNEEVRALKTEHEIQLVRLCEVTEQKKKDEEDKEMTDEDIRQMATSLDERIKEVYRQTCNQFDVVNQLLSSNHEIARNMEEIANLISKNYQLKSELRDEK